MAARVVREALATIAAPTVATRVLHRALHLSGEHEIPAGGSRLRRFVERHLHSGAAFVLGTDLADTLVEQLAPLVAPLPSVEPRPRGKALLELEAAGLVEPGRELEAEPWGDPREPLDSFDSLSHRVGGVSRRTSLDDELEGEPHPLDRRRTEPAPSVTVVLLATQEEAIATAFRESLGRDALVVQIADVVALLDAVQQHERAPLCIVVHGASASVHPSTLATVADDLPDGTAIAFWGVAREARRDSMELTDPRSWLVIPGELDGHSAGDELRRLLGLPTSGVFAARTR
jgi:hypothetical protein